MNKPSEELRGMLGGDSSSARRLGNNPKAAAGISSKEESSPEERLSLGLDTAFVFFIGLNFGEGLLLFATKASSVVVMGLLLKPPTLEMESSLALRVARLVLDFIGSFTRSNGGVCLLLF